MNQFSFVIAGISLVMLLSGCAGLGGLSGDDKARDEIKDSRVVMTTLKQALEAKNNNDIESANTTFQRMMSEGAKSADALNHYAIFLREQWKIEEAEAVYLTALKYSPDNAMTHYNLAVLYDVYLGKFDRAIAHYKRYQKVSPDPDKRVKAWVMDLERRAKQAKSEKSDSEDGGLS